MFIHQHPYPPFLFEGVEKLIVGTLPPPRFSIGDLKKGDVDFCYGSRHGQLWSILNTIFDLKLKFETTTEAIEQRKTFLKHRKIGVCDIVEKACRHQMDASDLRLENVQLRNLLKYLEEYPSVHTLLFTGGNSKNGPEYFFRRHLKTHTLKLKVVNNNVPRIHTTIHVKFLLTNGNYIYKSIPCIILAQNSHCDTKRKKAPVRAPVLLGGFCRLSLRLY